MSRLSHFTSRRPRGFGTQLPPVQRLACSPRVPWVLRQVLSVYDRRSLRATATNGQCTLRMSPPGRTSWVRASGGARFMAGNWLESRQTPQAVARLPSGPVTIMGGGGRRWYRTTDPLLVKHSPASLSNPACLRIHNNISELRYFHSRPTLGAFGPFRGLLFTNVYQEDCRGGRCKALGRRKSLGRRVVRI
jgi:hypothetical protein